MADILFIVSRSARTLFEYLTRYAADDRVEIILDRRQQALPMPRGRDRRRQDIDAQLRDRGWAIVDRRPTRGDRLAG